MAAFGTMIHNYAHTEFGIKLTISGILEMHLFDCLILCEPYNASSLVVVAKSVAKSAPRLSKGERERFCWIIGEFSKHGTLRNYIAHCRWTEGTRPASLKPIRIDIRSGKPVLLGAKEGEQDWIAEEIESSASELLNLNSEIIDFQQSTGIASIIASKQAAFNAAIESDGGNIIR